ncbi:MAG: MBOAT family protein [Bacteroidales bacterium]|nr:MBOAT family protein [Candidatus Liminaster caballi]
MNYIIVAISYALYSLWDWRFLFLIAFTSLCSWASGLLIVRSHRPKLWLVVNVTVNLGILGVFKYYDFFVRSFATLTGISPDGMLLNLILPVGISFYTFQALSYTIDVYRGTIRPTTDIVAFFAFVSFFPQLVAGPIERASNLLPQFLSRRRFCYGEAVDGMRQALWGLFKKAVIADTCATFVNFVFDRYETLGSGYLLLAAVLFSFQIYGDFSGYSDIAIGVSKLFGIHLSRNFNVPYFSRDITEFWRRWHISLTTWFRDYVYIPLGGSRPVISPDSRHPELHRRLIIIRNTMVIFLLSGFWHGANWTFICWGLFNALLFLPFILTGRNRRHVGDNATLSDLPSVILTFVCVTVGWILFRVESIADFLPYCQQMLTHSPISGMGEALIRADVRNSLIFIAVMTIAEWKTRTCRHGLSFVSGIPHTWLRFAIYYVLILLIWKYGTTPQTFIYFQF